jgi:UrcA family protein
MFTRFFKSNVAASLAIGVAVTAFFPMCSQADQPARTERLSFPRTKLQSDEGARKVYILIVQAANSACETSSIDTDVIMRSGPGSCVQQAVARAVRQLDSQKLAQVYVANNGIDRAREYGISEAARTASN